MRFTRASHPCCICNKARFFMWEPDDIYCWRHIPWRMGLRIRMWQEAKRLGDR